MNQWTPDNPSDSAADRLLSDILPLIDLPNGDLPSADILAAFGERRLPPEEDAALCRAILASPAARVELRSLYPERYYEALGVEPEPRSLQGTEPEPAVAPATPPDATPLARVLPFRRLKIASVVATAALVAAAMLLLVPLPPPSGADLNVSHAGAARLRASSVTARPREVVHLLVRLGEPGRWARLRGAEAWGGVFGISPSGRISLIATSDTVRSTDSTMGISLTVPDEPGQWRYALVSGSGAPPAGEAELVADLANRAGGGRGALDAVLAERGGGRTVQAIHTLRVEPNDPR